jgi:hypothetical protein
VNAVRSPSVIPRRNVFSGNETIVAPTVPKNTRMNAS